MRVRLGPQVAVDGEPVGALAASEQAALVSGDQHLLSLRSELPTYSPAHFW